MRNCSELLSCQLAVRIWYDQNTGGSSAWQSKLAWWRPSCRSRELGRQIGDLWDEIGCWCRTQSFADEVDRIIPADSFRLLRVRIGIMYLTGHLSPCMEKQWDIWSFHEYARGIVDSGVWGASVKRRSLLVDCLICRSSLRPRQPRCHP